MQKRIRGLVLDVLLVTLGSAIYALGFDLFMQPNEINAGGMTGLAMVLVKLTGFGTVGTIVIVCNIPLFLAGWRSLGRKFFLGSLLGMLVSNVAIDVLGGILPQVTVEPLLACLYGGALSGVGLGLVFVRGASTGGTDIAVRLVQRRARGLSLGRVMLISDVGIAVLTGLAFHDFNKALYSMILIYVNSKVLDSVIYGFDYSKVALIISDRHEEIAHAIDQKLERGATFLQGFGSYTGREKKVVLVAFKPRQLAELKQAVSEVDRDAFLIVQDAHQVLGEGFAHYSKDAM